IFTITQKDENELIGEIGLRLETEHNKAEIGYWIAEPYWGKGIATEAVAAVIKFGFEEIKLNKIFATCFDGNDVSGKVLEKNSMILEGNLKQEYFFKGEYRDSLHYRITKDEYLNL
ncbi:MAG: GNAT family protein, partial [Candidatus Kapaibacterium sp.]